MPKNCLTISGIFSILYLSRGKRNKTLTNKEFDMITAREFINSEISKDQSWKDYYYNDMSTEKDWNWLQEYRIDDCGINLGIDGSISEIEEEYIPNWESFSDMISPKKMYVVDMKDDGCEFVYECDKETVQKVMQFAVAALAGDEDFLDTTGLYSGQELLDYIEEQIEYLKNELDDARAMEETYESLRRPW